MANNNVNEEAVKNAANVAGKNAKALSEGMQYALITCLPNIGNGAFWGFDTLQNVKKHADVIKSDNNITARKLANTGCIIEVDPNYIMTAAVSALPGAINQNDIAGMKKAMGEAEAEFIKFLIKKGKTGNFVGKIGIYCINDSTSITLKGVSYPAFRLPISKVLDICNKLGYQIKVGVNFIAPVQAIQAGNALFDSFELSPTKTGVFCEIKSTFNPAKIAEIEAQYTGKAPKSKK